MTLAKRRTNEPEGEAMAGDASQKDEYLMVGQYAGSPGAARLIFSKASGLVLKQLEEERKDRAYRVRSFLSSSYELPTTGREAMGGSTRTHIRLPRGEQTCRIWTRRQPMCFRLEPGSDGYLQSVSGWARAELPLEALHVFKTAVALLLDRMSVAADLPLYVRRTELELDDEGHKLTEIMSHLEAEADATYGVGYFLPVFFLTYTSLEREALCSASPIYRFMCRWRAYESIAPTRRAVYEFAKKAGRTQGLPRAPAPTEADRAEMGLTDVHKEARTFHEIVECHRSLRDAVAHLWSGGKHASRKGTVLPFRSRDVETCEHAARIIQACNRKLMAPVWRYFEENLEEAYIRGHVLPTDGREAEYCASVEALSFAL